MPETERRRRRRQFVLLAVAVVAFAAMIVLVATGVTRRRHARDLTFGLEELDILLDDRSIAEAAAMIPWLADRVRTSAEGLRVLKRGYALYESDGLAGPLDEAASRLLREFPANATIRSIAVFASVRAGRADAALELAREGLGSDAGTLYAWTLLNNPEAGLDGEPTDELLLAGLGRASPAADFEGAWRMSGDQRYALDAALLHLRDRSPDRAAEILTTAGLVQRWPRFSAEVLLDRARYEEAIAVLARLPESSREAQLQLADANVYLGKEDAARAIYERLLLLARPPLHALLGLASLEDDPERRALLIERAAGLYPDAWEAARAQAVTGAGSGADALAGWDGTEYEGQARLLRLRLEARPDRRGYAAELWTLLSAHRSQEGYRYAAWYFASRDARDDLRLVLERARAGGEEASWWLAYDGILAAAAGAWDEAASRFEAAFVRSPAWQPALNAAVALTRAGDRSGARARLQDALLLARHSNRDRRIAVFLVAARAARDQAEARRIVAEAIAIDPDHPEVLLLGAQLEKAPAR